MEFYDAYKTIGNNARSLHSQRDAIEKYDKEHELIEPLALGQIQTEMSYLRLLAEQVARVGHERALADLLVAVAQLEISNLRELPASEST